MGSSYGTPFVLHQKTKSSLDGVLFTVVEAARSHSAVAGSVSKTGTGTSPGDATFYPECSECSIAEPGNLQLVSLCAIRMAFCLTPLYSHKLLGNSLRVLLIDVLQVHNRVASDVETQRLVYQLPIILSLCHMQIHNSSIVWSLDVKMQSKMRNTRLVDLDRMC